jgi:hypothetical protein
MSLVPRSLILLLIGQTNISSSMEMLQAIKINMVDSLQTKQMKKKYQITRMKIQFIGILPLSKK